MIVHPGVFLSVPFAFLVLLMVGFALTALVPVLLALGAVRVVVEVVVNLQIEVAQQVMDEICGPRPAQIMVYNKMDLTEERPLDASGHDSVFVSAKTGQNVDELLRKIDQVLTGDLVQTTFAIPYDKGGITSALCGCGQVESMDYTETATILRGGCRREDLGRYRDYLM